MDSFEDLNYSQLLRQYIKESGLTLDEISKRCEELGVTVHPTYISKLRLGKRPAPSKEITAALSKVTGGVEDKLQMLSLFEKLPEEDRLTISKINYYAESVSDSIDHALIQLIKFAYFDKDNGFNDQDNAFNDFVRIIRVFATKQNIAVDINDLLDPETINKLVVSHLESHKKTELLNYLEQLSSGVYMPDIPVESDEEFEKWAANDQNFVEMNKLKEQFIRDVENSILDGTKELNSSKESNTNYFDNIEAKTPPTIKAWLRSDDDLNEQEKEELAEDLEEYFIMRKQRILKEREKRQE